jgi:hypothetical protein
MFEMMCCRKCNTSLRRSCSLCSSQGARRDTVCLEAAVRVAPELSSTEGRARAARATPEGIAPSKQSSEDRCRGVSGGAGAGPAAQAQLAGTSRVGRDRDAE